MKILCIHSQGSALTRGKIYEAVNGNDWAYELYDVANYIIMVAKTDFVCMTTENIKEHLLPLIKLTELLRDDVASDEELDKANKCIDNLTSALGYLELLEHE